jgi:predicted Zn-dependent protease
MTRLGDLGIRLAAVAVLFCVLAAPAPAATIIRDTEIEDMLASIAEPIFGAAGLSPGAVEIYVVNDDTLNAFVAGGQKLFLNTGLVMRAETPEQLAGVIAHETGHIAGGHLSRTGQALETAGYQSIIGALLGAAAAAAGAPQVGTAIIAGGATLAQRGFLAFSRSQEQAADQAAIGFLAQVGVSPEGLAEFLETLATRDLRISSEGDVYSRSHPLTRDRIEFVEHQAEVSPYRGRHYDPALQAAFERSRAKLEAFLGNAQAMIQKYSGADLVSRYARAIALYRVPQLDDALALVDGLISDRSGDPYFHELKGQILFENGRIDDAVAPFREALRLRPDAALIRIGLARALLERGTAGDAKEAASLLREAVRLEPDNPGAWRFLGIAEGKVGDIGASAMALAEAAVLLRNKEDAQLYVARAEQHVKTGDPAWLRLQDLQRTVDDMETRGRR